MVGPLEVGEDLEDLSALEGVWPEGELDAGA